MRQLLLVSLLILLIPLFLFPDRVGTGLVEASIVYVLVELLYYVVIAMIFVTGGSVIRSLQFAGICLIYRLALGAMFGIMVVAFFSMGFKAALILGMTGYLPAVLLHIAIAPFILRSIASEEDERGRRRRISTPPVMSQMAPPTPHLSPVGSRTKPVNVGRERQPLRADTAGHHHSGDIPMPGSAGDPGGFDRSAHYLGEDSSVQAALVVDDEGLVLGQFCRGDIIPEDWAPLALLVEASASHALQRVGVAATDRVDIEVDERRVIVTRATGCYLMVIANRQSSEVLRIRIHQAVDMINKYVEQRYYQTLVPNAEMAYVSSTQ
jgi:predicted regulator of Ras-like GTPase activity (Roadblock/LC7/MglB family)